MFLSFLTNPTFCVLIGYRNAVASVIGLNALLRVKCEEISALSPVRDQVDKKKKKRLLGESLPETRHVTRCYC